jgi:hypothetical protein
MLKTLAALAALTHLGNNAPAEKALSDQLARFPVIQLDSLVVSGRACAIPLLDPSVSTPKSIDPIAHSRVPRTFDRIAHPAEIPACKSQH